MQTLAGRVVLVAGAAGGIGTELTRGFLEAGASVMAADVSEAGLDALRRRLADASLPGRLVCRAVDISDHKACDASIEAARQQLGPVDILINNAGLGLNSIRENCMTDLVAIEEIAPEVWDRFVAINFSGAWYMTRAAVPGMKSRGWGRIITVTTSFFTMLRGQFHPYGPTKAGLEAMAAGHAQEFSGTGITVNVVVPGGPADTPMVPQSSGMRRSDLIRPAKMVPPMLWLCSRAADGVSGNRYVAAHWDETAPLEAARAAAEAPIAWPGLAGAPVWPGGKPRD
jgi:NAD(P)-dependent dehydrogenase (short-subunit alcohol dehydrogenase family)